MPYFEIAAGLLLLLFASLNVFQKFWKSRVKPSPSLLIIISGCDSGLGELLAERLAGLGFTVFAGCLTEVGVVRWKGVPRVVAFQLDVCSDASVNAAETRVKTWLSEGNVLNPRSIHCVVNNAGVGESGLVDWMPLSGFRRTMEVNFFGAVALTKALLPTLLDTAAKCRRERAPPPRIINVTSVAGLIAVPGLSAYCASKFALEAFSDSMRLELSPWCCPVCLIEPSFLATPIIEGTKERQLAAWKSLPSPTRRRWGDDYFNDALAQSEKTLASAESPHLGVDAMTDAVLHVSPNARYKAGTPGKTYLPFVAAMPAFLSDPIILWFGGRGIPEGILKK